jgi:hypothetical protein
MTELNGYFKSRYDLSGRDWLCRLPRWEIQAFAQYGRMLAVYGVKGGRERARTARRDERGRFLAAK